MYKKLILIGTILTITILVIGCGGVSQSEYDKAQATIADLENQISQMVYPPKYFENRTAIETWLNLTPKLGISKDIEQWFQYALYYQQKALEAGYYLSVSYTVKNGGISITCDVVTVDGYIFYFDPDDCILKDTGIHIDMVSMEELEHQLNSLKIK